MIYVKSFLCLLVVIAGFILNGWWTYEEAERADMVFLGDQDQTQIYPEDWVSKPWSMHLLDPDPPSGSDGVRFANADGISDLVSGFEEGGVSRIYFNPGPEKSKGFWDYVELPSPDVEDAVLIDLDQDDRMDLVTASEGQTNQIRIHWAPRLKEDYRVSAQWKTQSIPAVENISAWMFVVPMDMDGQNGIDLIVGSKRKRGETGLDKAIVGWLQSPENPRSIRNWKFHPLSAAGWIMSIEVRDLNDDQQPDIIISDRRNSTRTGVRWLENPGRRNPGYYGTWKSHMIGLDLEEPMFHTSVDLDGDGTLEIVVPDLTRGLIVLKQTKSPLFPWSPHVIPYPEWAGPRGKAVSAADIDQDGQIDLVLSFEEEEHIAPLSFPEYREKGKYSVIWGSFTGNPVEGRWSWKKVSGLKGRKFDLINLVDLDGDGDLDVTTNDENEEGTGLGVVWYENLVR